MTFRLQKHVDSVHNKIKNFSCELCDYRCAEKGSLKIHVQESALVVCSIRCFKIYKIFHLKRPRQ